MVSNWNCINIDSSIDGECDVRVFRYEALDDLLAELYQMPIDELKVCEHGGYDGEGNEWNFTYNEMVDKIEKMGCYGFSLKPDEIHIWFDPKTVSPQDLVHLLAHENGHLNKPFHLNEMQEEIKAERYGDVAAFAYDCAVQLISKAAPPPNKEEGE